MPKRILVVEDDPDLARLLEIHLGDLGAEVETARDAPAGLAAALARDWDLVILDLALPGGDGLDICRRLRERSSHVPIIMLTARGTELDRVLGLEIGADDYVTKPFSVRELVARVRALFRRAEALGREPPREAPATIRIGGLEIDRERRAVTVDGRAVELTAKEFDLLELLARRPGRVHTREALLRQVWGYGFDGYEHTLVSHVSRLRRKIETDPSRPRRLLTVRGVGYKLADRGEG